MPFSASQADQAWPLRLLRSRNHSSARSSRIARPSTQGHHGAPSPDVASLSNASVGSSSSAVGAGVGVAEGEPVGAGAAATSGTAANGGAGANGRVRFRVLGPEGLSVSEGGSEPASEPVDTGNATASVSGTAMDGELLSVVFNNDDPDGAASALAYQWKRDGSAIAGATNSTYKAGTADIGHTLTAVVSYTDAKGFRDTITTAATASVLARPLPLDNFKSNEVFAAYSVRKLRNAYTGPLLQLRHGATEALQDFYPDASGWLDLAAITAWRTAQGAEFAPTRVSKWYDQSGANFHLDGLAQTVSNGPELGSSDSASTFYRLHNGSPAIRFNGNEEFIRQNFAGPSKRLGFLTVIERNNSAPGYVFQWDFSGFNTVKNVGFFLSDSASQDWSANAAVFHGNGFNSGRAPRAIVNDGFATDDTDAVIWEGELSAVRVGIRRNGHQFRLNVDNHASFTTIEQGVFTVGPRNFTTDKQARMAELIVFREDVRDTDAIRSTRASAAGAYLLGVDTELSDSGVSDPAVSSEQTSEPPASESHGSHTSEPHSSHTSEPPGGSSEGGSEPPGGSSESDVSEPPPVDAPPIQCVVVTI